MSALLHRLRGWLRLHKTVEKVVMGGNGEMPSRDDEAIDEKPAEVPPEIREASHRMANEAHAVQGQLQRMRRAEDPMRELERAIHAAADDVLKALKRDARR